MVLPVSQTCHPRFISSDPPLSEVHLTGTFASGEAENGSINQSLPQML